MRYESMDEERKSLLDLVKAQDEMSSVHKQAAKGLVSNAKARSVKTAKLVRYAEKLEELLQIDRAKLTNAVKELSEVSIMH